MKQAQISDRALIDALRRMAPETGSLICLGCGHERNCSVHGCAVLKAAVCRLEELSAAPPNPPLTLEELREMDGEPVWVVHPKNLFEPCWMLVMVRHDFVMANWQVCDFNTYGKTWLAYRRKLEEGTV